MSFSLSINTFRLSRDSAAEWLAFFTYLHTYLKLALGPPQAQLSKSHQDLSKQARGGLNYLSLYASNAHRRLSKQTNKYACSPLVGAFFFFTSRNAIKGSCCSFFLLRNGWHLLTGSDCRDVVCVKMIAITFPF